MKTAHLFTLSVALFGALWFAPPAEACRPDTTLRGEIFGAHGATDGIALNPLIQIAWGNKGGVLKAFDAAGKHVRDIRLDRRLAARSGALVLYQPAESLQPNTRYTLVAFDHRSNPGGIQLLEFTTGTRMQTFTPTSYAITITEMEETPVPRTSCEGGAMKISVKRSGGKSMSSVLAVFENRPNDKLFTQGDLETILGLTYFAKGEGMLSSNSLVSLSPGLSQEHAGKTVWLAELRADGSLGQPIALTLKPGATSAATAPVLPSANKPHAKRVWLLRLLTRALRG